ncbi:MAG: DUF3048 C-terminal domain-containing protein [Anaerolineales bacterium]|uniref:DUF3048 C-terminal domain-containing protein n=1 Tax=Candidatus Desulfolinea nitratireducens TaxID=2841698 RepID=A0A8J6NKF4_9CHLR|nr:DUF3048 C-terminal domain-containing protein [Candidatus Desulfolinea nitratireducens]MBL6959867.1 DUF3048 C-terminal domain-containing protein [Anaerolineales bacterium]
MKSSKIFFLSITLLLIGMSFSGCTKKRETASSSIPLRETSHTATPTPTPTFTPIPQPIGTTVSFGPNQEDFPEGINPLTGLSVSDPSLLEEPALLISVPHFPISARPQSGLSFSPWVFEFLIGEGTTRLLAVFYGEQPFEEKALVGDCEIRTEPFSHNGEILGNFVWLDKNGDGIQNAGEPGVGGVCVNLYNSNGELIQETSTDSNGYYGFAVEKGETYQIEFIPPEKMDFSPANLGDDKLDSDADPLSGMTGLLPIMNDYFLVDAGLMPPPNQTSILPGGKVGPIRSGRLLYIHIQNFFQNSCLIISGATREIIDKLPICSQVHNTENGAGSLLEIKRMITISEKNAINRGSHFNYASNLFAELPPAGGVPADQVDIFVSSVNQTKWIYDPLSKSWARYVDNASEETVFHRDIDKLTGRELSFENLIVLFVEHEVLATRIADMHMELGMLEKGILFRDGQKYEIKWSTRTTDYERSTGFRRPPAFQDLEGNPIALHPGHTWILIATPYSSVTELNTHQWKVRIFSPPGFGEY